MSILLEIVIEDVTFLLKVLQVILVDINVDSVARQVKYTFLIILHHFNCRKFLFIVIHYVWLFRNVSY